MYYTQKYTIVHFIHPIDEGTTFSMYEWPLHTTLADVFAINYSDELLTDLQQYADSLVPITTSVGKESMLSETPVWLLKKSKELQDLHVNLLEVLKKHDAQFNTPEFTREGFLPHITKQKNSAMYEGERVDIDSFSLVDMFPNGDWQERKVIAQFAWAKPKN